IPAADLSEQISTAGMEAPGTGNMKLALNGAITIGTLDGSNIEIRERIGGENILIFRPPPREGGEAPPRGVEARRRIAGSPELGHVLEAIASGEFSPDDRARYDGIVDDLKHRDYFMVSADFDAYRAAQGSVAALWRDSVSWRRTAILNTANVGWFSSDRAI